MSSHVIAATLNNIEFNLVEEFLQLFNPRVLGASPTNDVFSKKHNGIVDEIKLLLQLLFLFVRACGGDTFMSGRNNVCELYKLSCCVIS